MIHNDYYTLHNNHQRCYKMALASTDRKIKYGAIVVDGRTNQIMSYGWNYVPLGYDCAQCPRVLDKSIKSGTQLERCFAIHAEQDALAALSGNYQYNDDGKYELWILGVNPTDDSPIILEQATFTCSVCARLMYAFSINYVVVATANGPVKLGIDDALAMSFAYAEENKK